MSASVIVGYLRSPFTPAYKGQLATVRPDDLAAEVIKALVKQTGVKPEDIEDVLLGCAFPEGEQGFNLARMVGLLAGFLLGRATAPSEAPTDAPAAARAPEVPAAPAAAPNAPEATP